MCALRTCAGHRQHAIAYLGVLLCRRGRLIRLGADRAVARLDLDMTPAGAVSLSRWGLSLARRSSRLPCNLTAAGARAVFACRRGRGAHANVDSATFELPHRHVHAAQPRKLSNDFFFFQAEDGIRDLTVTGVQTCALPI